MTDKKGIVLLIILILIALVIGQQTIKFPKGLLFVFSDLENQIKQDYNAYWDDATNGYLDSAYTKYYEQEGFTSRYQNEKFTCDVIGDGRISMGDTSGKNGINSYNSIYAGASSGNIDCKTKKDFKGQEIVLLVSSIGQGKINGYSMKGLIIFKPRSLTPNIYDIYVDGNKIIDGINYQNGLFIQFGGGLGTGIVIDYIGSKALFSCDLSNNERWIETQWQGSVSINDLIQKDGLIPTKFCKETRPFVLRDLQQGETPIYPDPIPSFNKGDTIISSNPNQLIVVRYAAYQVQGLENPTTGTQAYTCDQRDLNFKCLHWSIKEVIKPVEITVQCKTDSDCPLPLTKFQDTSCLGYFKGCQNNKCVYDNTILDAPKCQNQVVTIIKQIQEIEKRSIIQPIGINTFSFSQNKDRTNFLIGDTLFSSSLPKFLCNSNDDIINVPSPSSDCWETTINFNGNYKLKDSQSIFLDSQNIIKVKYFASGTYVINPEFKRPTDKTNFRDDNWGNSFIFSIDAEKAFQIEGTYGEQILRNSNNKLQFSAINNLPQGKSLIKLRQKVRNTNQNLEEKTKEIVLKKGITPILFDINTANLGLNDVVVSLFYEIDSDSKVLLPIGTLSLTYNIVDELPVKIIEKPIIIEPVEPTEPSKTYFSTIPFWAKAVGIIISGIMLFWWLS